MTRIGLAVLLLSLVACDDGQPPGQAPIIVLEPAPDMSADAQADAEVGRCGDGRRSADEQCDDGNTVDADGCNARCALEVCGDGQLHAGEQCDDGNQRSGDGCTADCRLEICGDGERAMDEACDDGNLIAGDGCDADCRTERCGNGRIDANEACDDGNVRSGDGCNAACLDEVCGDGVVNVGEACDDGNLQSGDGCNARCQAEVCGNDVEDEGEACDDGNRVGGDGCSAECALEACGNTVMDVGEQCDDGNLDPGDGCSPTCRLEACGNGTLDPAEVCDDGNRVVGDGCNAECRPEVCGNTVVDAGEQCDDGNLGAGDGCNATCQREICGNAVLDSGEACDDGNVDPADGCSATCTVEVCGDGRQEPHEGCDDGNQVAGDGCSAICGLEICGNAVLDVDEGCDDGNRVAGDGCDAECRAEVCGNARLEAAEECDDGNLLPADGCSAVCRVEVCGNGEVDPGEDCDDANVIAGDGCNAVCLLEVCGDGVLHVGEECDDANIDGGDGCSPECGVEACGNGVLDFGEDCDDGNQQLLDGCTVDCRIEPCGNGVVGPGEACDDGNLVRGDGCDSLCQIEGCGNGVRDLGEFCDDGSDEFLDGCHACERRSPSFCVDECNRDGTLGAAHAVQQVSIPLDGFGRAVAMHDDMAVISARHELVVFRRAAEAWRRTATLEPISGVNSLVATHSGRVVVSACSRTASPPEVFWQDDAGAWRAQQLERLESGDGYGCSLDMHDETVAVGAYSAGGVHLFDREPDGVWRQSQRLKIADGDGAEHFGWALSLDGDTLVVGAPEQNAGALRSGAVHVFERVDGRWRPTQVITPDDAEADDEFGRYLHLRGGQLIVGAERDERDGAAYVFIRDFDGWRQTARLTAPEDFRRPRFGQGVRLGDGLAFINGTHQPAGIGHVAATYVFAYEADGEWRHRQLISPSEGRNPHSLNPFTADNHVVLLGQLRGAQFIDVDVPVCHPDGACACVDGAAGADCRARPQCGDGILQRAEYCDDGNDERGDGCGGCSVERGWRCDRPGRPCTAICGDSLVVGREFCDDGNQVMLFDECGPCQSLVPVFCGACDDAGTLGRPQARTIPVPELGRLSNAQLVADTLAIGPPAFGGTRDVLVFNRDAEGVWRQAESLAPEYEDPRYRYSHVALSARWLATAIGSSLHFFQRDAEGGWDLEQIVFAPGFAGANGPVALHGDWAFVPIKPHTVLRDFETLDVHVYRHDGVRWNEHQRIAIAGEPAWAERRPVVTIDDGELWISGHSVRLDGGIVRTYRLQGDQWTHAQTLTMDVDGPKGRFGYAMAVSGAWAMVGAPQLGVVNVYQKDEAGQWSLDQQLRTPFGGGDRVGFGTTIALRGAHAMVGGVRYILDDTETWIAAELVGQGAIGDRFMAVPSVDPVGVTFLDLGQNEPHCLLGPVCLCVSGATGNDCAGREGCGNGRVDAVEQCDDGNQIDDDGCSATCMIECGDGVVTGEEACDDGGQLPGDGCGSTCQIEACGNRIVDAGETCDDGNHIDGDRCDAQCQSEYCGNGILNPGEVCDDGNLDPDDGCSPTCRLCGNGQVDADESCDDGNRSDGDGCSADCTIEACGNGVIDLGETCDDGNPFADDGCSPICTREVCGSGVIDAGEDCDDGNDDPLDGCDACRVRLPSQCDDACDSLYSAGRPAPPFMATTPFMNESFARQLAISTHFALVSDSGASDLYRRAIDGAWQWVQSLETEDRIGFNLGGTRLAMRDDVAALGEVARDSVHIFKPQADGNWYHLETLRFDNLSHFGSALAMHGGTLIVGAPGARAFVGDDRGAALIFEERADGRWFEVARFEGPSESSHAGQSAALQGRWALVGMPYDDAVDFNAGQVMVLRRDDEGIWQRHQVLAAPAPVIAEFFGQRIALADGKLAIGGTQRVYLYALDDDQWILTQEYEAGAPDGPLVFQDDRLLIGDAEANQIERIQQAPDGAWVVDAPLLAPTPIDAGFGATLAVHGHTLLAHASETLNARGRPGVVHFLDLREPACFADGQCVCLDGADGPTCADLSNCGDGVQQAAEGCDDGGVIPGDGCDAHCAVEPGWRCTDDGCTTTCGDGLVRGDEACDDGNSGLFGACYDCRVQGADLCDSPCAPEGTAAIWQATSVTLDAPVMDDLLGDSVALHGDTLVANTVRDAAGEEAPGAVIFERGAAGDFIELQRIEPDTEGMVDELGAPFGFDAVEPVTSFGQVMAVDDRWLIIGAPEHLHLSGTVFIFERGDDGWRQVQVLRSIRPAVQGYFGLAVALRDDRLLVTSGWGSTHAYQLLADGWQLELTRGQSAGGVVLDDELAYISDSASGEIYVYALNAPLNGPLQAIELPAKRNFGRTFAISGDSMLVGGVFDQYTLGPRQIFAFRRGADGAWTQTQRIDSPERRFSWTFGAALSMQGDTAWAISRNDELERAFAYRLQQDAAGHWDIVQRLSIEDGVFSRTIGQSGDTVVIGVPRSADRPSGAMVLEPAPLCDDRGACVCVDDAVGEHCAAGPD